MPGFDFSRLIGSKLIELSYPPTCLLCGAAGQTDRDLCAGCAADLPRNLNACVCCALPFECSMPAETLCGRCQQQPPAFEHCLTAFRYTHAVPMLIRGAKFHRRLNAARLLGQCLADRVHDAGLEAPDLLIPVPIHRARLRERGYNQSHEIARVLGREFGVPIDVSSCARVLATSAQTGLDEHARQCNVRGAFVTTGIFRQARLAIVDDVVTTGSTVNELAQVLLRAGAARVDVWAVARTSWKNGRSGQG